MVIITTVTKKSKLPLNAILILYDSVVEVGYLMAKHPRLPKLNKLSEPTQLVGQDSDYQESK